MSFKSFIARYLLGVRTEVLPWAQDAWNAVQDGGPLRIEEDDATEQLGLDPKQSEARKLRNEQISIFYVKSRSGENSRETLDMRIMAKKRGGLIVRFINGNALNWNRPSARSRYEVSQRERYWYLKIVEEVRKAD